MLLLYVAAMKLTIQDGGISLPLKSCQVLIVHTQKNESEEKPDRSDLTLLSGC